MAVPYSSVPHIYSVLRFRVPARSPYFLSLSKREMLSLTRITDKIVQGRKGNGGYDSTDRLYTSALRVLPMMLPSGQETNSKWKGLKMSFFNLHT